MSFGQLKIVSFSGAKRSGKNTAAAFAADLLMEHGIYNCTQVLVTQMAFAEPLKRVLSLITGVSVQSMHNDEGKAAPCPPAQSTDAHQVCDAMFGDLRPVQWSAADGHLKSNFNADFRLGIDGILAGIPKALSHFAKLQQVEPGMSVGRALQLLGTECFRDHVSDGVWLVCASVRLMFLQECARISPTPVYVLFTDARFPNELAWLKSQSGHTVYIRGFANGKLNDGRDDQHASERALDGARYDYEVANTGSLAELRSAVLGTVLINGVFSGV